MGFSLLPNNSALTGNSICDSHKILGINVMYTLAHVLSIIKINTDYVFPRNFSS